MTFVCGDVNYSLVCDVAIEWSSFLVCFCCGQVQMSLFLMACDRKGSGVTWLVCDDSH